MDAVDLELRNLTYAKVVELGRVPAVAEVAAAADSEPAEVVAGWRRLHSQHALVLNAAADEIRMANPFSGVPTAYRVQAAGRWWYANCAWDAFGIVAALGLRDAVVTSDGVDLHVRDGRIADDALFEVSVPARYWWDDIEFT